MDRRGFLASVGAVGVVATASVAKAKNAPSFDPTERSIGELSEAMIQGATTSRALVRAYVSRIHRFDQGPDGLHAVLALNPDAERAAAQLDSERAAGHVRGPLHGIPLLLKDNIESKDPLPTTLSLIHI